METYIYFTYPPVVNRVNIVAVLLYAIVVFQERVEPAAGELLYCCLGGEEVNNSLRVKAMYCSVDDLDGLTHRGAGLRTFHNHFVLLDLAVGGDGAHYL